MSTTTNERRIWIGCLAAYNNGTLHGEWVDASDDLEEARERILAASPIPNAEEAFIADYEGFPEGTVGEYSQLGEVAELAEALEGIDHIPAEAVDAFIGNEPSDPAERIRKLEDGAYCGEWDSGADYAQEFYDQQGTDLGPLASYVDWGAVWTGEFECGDYWISGGHVFNENA